MGLGEILRARPSTRHSPARALLPAARQAGGPGGPADMQLEWAGLPTCPTACCALALLAAAMRIGAMRICGDVVRSCSLINKSSCYLWKYFGWSGFVHSPLPEVIKSLSGIKPFVSRDPGLSQDLCKQINAYVFPTV